MHPPHPLRTATGVIAVVTAVVSLVPILLGMVEPAARLLGFIPARLSGEMPGLIAVPVVVTPLTATLIHGSFLHLAGNLLMLVWCGLAVERALGRDAVLILYGVGAYIAAGAQFMVGPHALSPMIGASGAISALIGAFALSYGQQKRLVASRAFNRWINVAWLMAAWVLIQLGFGYLMGTQGMMLATPAHIGGFLAGLALQRPLLMWRYRHA
ncbi:MAG: rhomboid family intramembrane serine protease [Sphingomicrobium sp.]|nr:rhomboid family intramembrane serine protease [Sphingomonadales bacterium]